MKIKIVKKVIPYFIILSSLTIVFFSFKQGVFLNDTIKKSDNIAELYIKNKYEKEITEILKIAIKNGCGIKNLGLIYKRYLLDIGCDVTEASNAEHFGHDLTKIIFHKKNKSSAIHLSKILGIHENQIIEKTNLNNFHDLTLILGQNYNHLKSYKIAKNFNPFK